MFDSNRLLVSIPARELAHNTPTGSIFPFEELRNFTISTELAAGLDLLETACKSSGSTVTAIARPEIFTHGAALQWLLERVEDSKNHLCFSDGEAVRLIPQRINHVFFYRSGLVRCRQALNDLERRAPELFGHLHSQINSAFKFDKRLKSRLLCRRGIEEHAYWLLPFFVSRGGVGYDLQSLMAHDSVDQYSIGSPESTTYVACTETALALPEYAAALVADLTDAYLHPARCLIIEAPNIDRAISLPEQRLELLLLALHRHSPSLPSGLPNNVFIHMGGDAELPTPFRSSPARLIAHDSYPFWQRSKEFYSSFSELTVLRDERSCLDARLYRTTLAAITGRSWTEIALPRPDSPSVDRFRW